MNQIRFFVVGTPKPAGSKRAFVNKNTGKAILTDMSGQAGKDWRHDIQAFAQKVYTGAPLEEPLQLRVVFRQVRPKGHFGTGKNAHLLKPNAPMYPTGKPDCTKLLRSLEDSLTGIIWRDDAQIVSQSAWKFYCDDENPRPGALIVVEVLER